MIKVTRSLCAMYNYICVCMCVCVCVYVCVCVRMVASSTLNASSFTLKTSSFFFKASFLTAPSFPASIFVYDVIGSPSVTGVTVYFTPHIKYPRVTEGWLNDTEMLIEASKMHPAAG